MFTMMNLARLSVGLQGVAIAERATQAALAYARERKQGGHAIIDYPDVKRMLLTMRAQTRAARAICYATAVAIDRAHRLQGDDAKTAHERASLLTPVAKAFSTEIGVEMASLGIQVHGGMGYVEETGAAQHLRDARIAPIYEGTNGIQAIDLVTRKLPQSNGASVNAYLQELRVIVGNVQAANDPAFGATGERLAEAVDALDRATQWMLANVREQHRRRARRRHALFAFVRPDCRRLHAGGRGAGGAADRRSRRCGGPRFAGAVFRRELCCRRCRTGTLGDRGCGEREWRAALQN